MDSHCPNLRQSVILSAFLLLVPASVNANGAMGLALATFPWSVWVAYAIVTVLFEAAWLGRSFKIPLSRALRCSIGANLLTAILGGFFSGIVSYSFFGIFGSRMNPNPFGQTVFVFVLFGLGSALIEALVWSGPATEAAGKYKPLWILRNSMVAHLLVVPIGLGVLLIPEKPYVGLERQAEVARHGGYRSPIKHALEIYVAEHHAFPPVHSYEQLLTVLKPDLGAFGEDPYLWSAAYIPEFHRFDTHEMRRGPQVEWNQLVSGTKILDTSTGTKWLTRVRTNGRCYGFVIEMPYNIRRSASPTELGY